MITEVRVIGTGQVLFREDVPAGTCVSIRGEGIHVDWVEYEGEEFWITLSAPARVTWDGGHSINVGTESVLLDRLEPIENYLHRDWKMEDRGGIDADGWSIATVYSGIGTDGIGVGEMFKGNHSLIKNAARTYEAMIALYNEVMDDSDKEIDEDVLLAVADLAKEIQGECE